MPESLSDCDGTQGTWAGLGLYVMGSRFMGDLHDCKDMLLESPTAIKDLLCAICPSKRVIASGLDRQDALVPADRVLCWVASQSLTFAIELITIAWGTVSRGR